jgi:hypothetical protein
VIRKKMSIFHQLPQVNKLGRSLLNTILVKVKPLPHITSGFSELR